MDIEISGDELMFFERHTDILPIYVRLRQQLLAAHPEVRIKVSKTQISFINRHIYAMASLPARRFKGWPERYLLVSFGLLDKLDSQRIAAASNPYPNRWTHHVPVTDPSGIDAQLLGWLEEAYAVSLAK